ncbi:DUF5947 family protein [Sphaerisporangium aureirubrum]|uniref:DUF5947 family protein n=1 Tax=Sphaerisporangium aureirubrum TaxID=1544736 RepID=A0ABW1NNP6_9ACTN
MTPGGTRPGAAPRTAAGVRDTIGAGLPGADGPGAAPRGLRRFRVPPPEGAARCEMCAEPVGERHGHVVDAGSRALLCACKGCHLLLARNGALGAGRYRAVPERYLNFPSFALTDGDWDELRVPVRTAFFFHNSALGQVVAFYPSPGGATEASVPAGAWDRVLAAAPELAAASPLPDVEAFLVDRRPDEGFTCHLVPVDACYELVGLVRTHWKGFHGGREAWDAIEAFFTRLRERGEDVLPGNGPGPDAVAGRADVPTAEGSGRA